MAKKKALDADKLSELNGTQYLVKRLIDLQEQIDAARADIQTAVGLVSALGGALGYKLKTRQSDKGETIFWEQKGGRIILP